MRINRYKIKDGVTLEDLQKYHVREGGTWIDKNCKHFISKYFRIKKTDFEFTIDIGFFQDISDFDDFKNVLVLDEDFGHPYFPFYNHYGEDVNNFSILEKVIEEYNEFMDSLDIFERI